MYTDQTFIDCWDVVEVQRRIRGEWKHEYDFVPAEWMIFFFEQGRHTEMFNLAGTEVVTTCDWIFAASSGIISLHPDDEPKEVVRKLVFGRTDGEAYLYFYDDDPHIVHDSDAIIRHHAHTRWRIEEFRHRCDR